MKIKIISLMLVIISMMLLLTGCFEGDASQQARQDARYVQNRLVELQPMPTDIEYSFERMNISSRTYWINGLPERAAVVRAMAPPRPLGYIVLFAPNGGVVGRFEVDGKVTSLNYSLVPYSEYWERGFGSSVQRNNWIANPGGVYGTNTNGVFWFTPDGKYMEWNGTYLFSDVPFIIDDPVLRISGGN